MAPERPIAYLPFHSLVGEEEARRILDLFYARGFEPFEVEDPQTFAEKKEPPPRFLVVMLEQAEPGSSESGPWLSSVDRNVLNTATQTAWSSGIPVLCILLGHEPNHHMISVLPTPPFFRIPSYRFPKNRGRSLGIFSRVVRDREELLPVIGELIEFLEARRPDIRDPRTESITPSSLSDAAAKRDMLGFTPYVEGIERFLTNKETKGPLTMSIEGEWGSGKSSFMLQLQERLSRGGAQTVWFNSWRHDQEESLWAAFAIAFVDSLSRQLRRQSRWARFKASFSLAWKRFDWRGGWKDVAKTVASAVLWIIVAVAVWGWGKELFVVDGKTVGVEGAVYVLLGAGGTLAALRGIARVVQDATEIVGNPLRFDLKKHVKSEDYAGRISFIERFHKDFSKIIDAYVGKNKVYVFVDDLDRCEVPKAAELMQAMNLMIGDDGRLVFIIGMDREKVAAGLAVKYEELLPYLSGKDEEKFERVKGRFGIEFGFAFIEKFVQLPFRVPAAGEKELQRFLDMLSSVAVGEDPAPQKSLTAKLFRVGLWPFFQKRLSKGTTEESSPDDTAESEDGSQSERNWSEFALEDGNDSASVKKAVLLVADIFDHNPRRIKQFLNSFRLKAYIAYRTGLLNSGTEEDAEEGTAITFEQLAKFVALGLRWPVFLADLDEDEDLLSRLSHYAEGRTPGGAPTEIEQKWQEDPALLYLLRKNADLDGENREYWKYTMTTLDVQRLLEISPRVVPEQVIRASTATAAGSSVVDQPTITTIIAEDAKPRRVKK